ncbi:glycosyltransferase family 4 protein [Flavivirga jejuensis]|uniref:Glycosyltransferase family 4 protein n=1 Tax=Flavivirga jejuensis TaxID=870487 RepID=A0ABT8WT71_9FLAO|nr:glycosyltransferase family 4 protein [Flavivirga jejuensis]MDO5976385.1 glycosyltransferase family 4 protein [Flavivirga jejuensis]
MKILIIHNKYGKYSGEEAVVDAQIDLLKSNNHQVITYFRSSEELENQANGKIKAFFSAFHNSKVIHDIKKLIYKEAPDLVHIHNLYPIISPAILPEIKKIGIPIVMTVHNYRLLCPNGLFYTNGTICEKCTGLGKELNCITNNCEGSIFKSTGYAFRNMWARRKKYYIDNVDAYLCLTSFQKNKLIANQFEANKCFVIPNIYSKTLIDIDYNINERNYIAFAGRISPEKGIPILLAAAKKLPHINFQMAGLMRKGYQKELEIPFNVKLRGMLNADEMKVFYSKARLYLHTSVCYEGFPMVFPEAMAYKLPIIAPRMAGYPEIAEDGYNGILFEPKNVEDLAKVLSNIWDDNNKLKRLGSNGYSMVKEKYSVNAYYESLLFVYNLILKL